MTQHHTIEPEIRAALAAQAARIPADTAARLGRRNYHPRTRSAASIAVVGLATVAAAATVSFYAAGLVQHRPSPMTRASAQTIRLDGYTFRLPKGFGKTGTACTLPPPPGITGPPAPRSTAYAAGAAAHGGCVGLIFTSQQIAPPSSATPVQVGQDHGFVAADSATRSLTLYVSISTPGSTPWLVITATGLSQSQITNMAGRALSS